MPTPSYTAPYPTLIEYSGYGYANPAGPENGIAVLANLMGFAVVDVNMRGTGCSGGAFDFFEQLQNLDGYDVIETIAHQPWVLGHKVGMLGISYGGISQLFTAQLRPPDLAAIAPLSVIDATATTLYPGGILNTGFAVAWAEQRQQNAEPAGPGHGQAWAYQRIQEGDQTCAANQALHGEAADLMAKIQANSTYNPAVADPLDPVTFVHKINVPTFLACQWEDEQTGGHCADLAQHFTGTTRKWFTFTNGAHIDSLDPYTFNRLYDFLELYVAHQAPIVNQAVPRAAAPVIYQAAMGLPPGDLVTLPPDPIQQQPTYESALGAFEALPAVRVLFDNGAGTSPTGTSTPGDPYPGFEQSFSKLPIPGTKALSLYFGPGGALTAQPPSAEGVDSYTSDASAVPLTDYGANTGSGGLWGNASQWQWNWVQPPAGSAVSYVSAPLTSDTTAIGGGAVRLWVKSSTPDVDLQATVSEVRPDGNETFVQNGWIRASERKLATDSNNMFKQSPTRAAADPDLPRLRRAADARERIRAGRDPAVLRGPRLPRGLAHQGHDRRAERHAAGLVVRADAAGGRHGDRVDRVLAEHAVEPDPADRARRERADAAARVPEPAQRAVPQLPGGRERRLLRGRRRLRRRRAARAAAPHAVALSSGLRCECVCFGARGLHVGSAGGAHRQGSACARESQRLRGRLRARAVPR